MQTKPITQFKKSREIGEILSDTFSFVRNNFKSLFKAIWQICGPYFILLLAVTGYYVYEAGDFSLGDFANNSTTGMSLINANGLTGGLILSGLLLLISSLVFYAFFTATINYYIKSYVANNGQVDLDKIKQNVNQNWLSFLGMQIIIGLIIFIGLIACVIPGIYFAVPLSLIFSVYAFQEKEIGEAFSSCFSLIKNNWWNSFLALFVMAILVYFMNFVFQLPLIIYTVVKTLLISKTASISDPTTLVDTVYIALNLISSTAQYLFYAIQLICVVFVYFNLHERKHQTGTLEKINQL